MKDRWKVFWISVIFSIILTTLFLFLGFSFRKVEASNWGIVLYDFYKLIDPNQLPRVSGNYLIGLDHKFIQLPRGYLSHSFTIKVLTKDKTIIDIQGVYLGKLIYNKLMNMTLTFGLNYQIFLFKSVQRLFRQALEEFSLSQMISDRLMVDSYVKNYVKSNIEGNYEWIETKFLNLGSLKTNIETKALAIDTSLQQNYLKLVNLTLFNQKKLNIYQSGGYDLLENIEKYHSNLFTNVTNRLGQIADKLIILNNKDEILPALTYIINDPSIPLLEKKINFEISK